MWNKWYIVSLLCLAILILTPGIRAQNDERHIIVDATLWTHSDDTIRCKLQYVNQYAMQFNITMVDTGGVPLKYFAPNDLAGFRYSMTDDSIEFTSMPNPTDLGRIFLRVVYRGKLSLYQFLELSPSSSSFSFTASYYIWDGKWKEPALTTKFEKESLLYHFSDCPELEYKIKTGQYGIIHIDQIMREYENCVLTDEYEFFYE